MKNERRFGVRWEQPGPKRREMIQMMRATWDCWYNETRPDFRGRFYNFTLMTPLFNPGPIKHSQIPVYIAGVNEYVCRIAGEMCEGFLSRLSFYRPFLPGDEDDRWREALRALRV